MLCYGRLKGLQGSYLEGHGDSVSSLMTPISHIITPIVPIITLLTKPPNTENQIGNALGHGVETGLFSGLLGIIANIILIVEGTPIRPRNDIADDSGAYRIQTHMLMG